MRIIMGEARCTNLVDLRHTVNKLSFGRAAPQLVSVLLVTYHTHDELQKAGQTSRLRWWGRRNIREIAAVQRRHGC